MAKKRRRKLRKEFVVFLMGLMALFLVFLLVLGLNRPKSNNPNALRYKVGRCTVFYPNGERKKEYAKELCANYHGEEKIIYDYELITRGDYYEVSYGDNGSYYVDKDFKEIKIDSINEEGKHIISDYLRYTAKKDKPDIYYNSTFLDKTYYENISLDNIEFEIVNEDLKVKENEYELEAYIPIKYLQKGLGINLGYEDDEYIKPKYLDLNRPMIALTFDDGPYEKVGQKIIDTLYHYDSNGTFYIVGNRLSNAELNYIKNSISKGNEYGSHSSDHLHFHDLSLEDATFQVQDTVDYLNNKIGYKMKTYRSPYGEHRDDVSEALKMTDILWNVDSYDWSSKNANSVFEKVTKEVDKNDIILLHEIHPSTASAIEKLVPYLVDQGYQLVTVSELMEALNINPNNVYQFGGR